MESVDYDAIAPVYDRRYEANDFAGVRATLSRFVESCRLVAEVGSGTGQWLKELTSVSRVLVGVDASSAMLVQSLKNAPEALLLRGRAEALPFRSQSFERLYCINALHHFQQPDVFIREAKRALSSGGGLLIIGLDPHTGLDQWWIYDYFPSALVADRTRYLPTASIRDLLARAGFVNISTQIAQHMPAAVGFAEAVEKGFLDRRSTSQLQVIEDAEWEAGLARLKAERPILRANLRLYATLGSVHDPASGA